MKVRIENNGHVIEIDAGSGGDLKDAASMAQVLWDSTHLEPGPALGMGFGSQLIERADDKPVAGNGAYEMKPEPHTARCICNTPPPTVVGEGKNKVATRPPGWRCPRHGEVI